MKFLHILYSNVCWNSKKGGFLLCSCNRIESEHQCKIIDDKQHLKLYKKARKKYKQLIATGTPEYKVPTLMNKWAAENNSGVNGLGISPEILPISRVRFDTMHMSMNITRRLLNHFEMLIKQHYDVAGFRLETKMLEFLSLQQLFMWKEGSSASKFDRNDLKIFTHNFVSLADWFREKSDIDVSASVQWDNF